MTMTDEDLFVIQLDAGETILEGRGFFNASEKCTLIVDRLGSTKKGALTCTGIRQVLSGWEARQCWAVDSKMRRICRDRGAELIHVDGGLPPLVDSETIAVADFSMSGTNWFLMPERIYNEIVG